MPIFRFIALVAFFTTKSSASLINLQDLLFLSAKNNPETRSLLAESLAIKASSQRLQAYFEPLWQSRLFHDSDSILTQQRFSQNSLSSLTTTGFETKLLKKFSLGTEVFGKIDIQKNKIFWLEETGRPSTENYSSNLSFGVQQPLLKNLHSESLSLQEKIILNKYSQSILLKNEKHQKKQSQIEQAYWQASSAKHHMSIASKKKHLLEEYVQLMQKRKNIGLADDVSLSEAIQQQLSAISQKTQAKHNFERSWENLVSIGQFPEDTSANQIKWGEPHTQEPVNALFFPNTIFEEILGQNLSLKNLHRKRQNQMSELQLLREKNKPDLKVGFETNYGGFGDSFSESAKDFKNKSTLFLSLEIPFNNHTFQSQTHEIQFRVQSIAEQEKLLTHQIKEETNHLISEFKRLKEQMMLIQKHLEALQNLTDAEQRKFTQARSDRVLMIRYEVDALELKKKLISIATERHKISSQMKRFTNSYSEGVSSL